MDSLLLLDDDEEVNRKLDAEQLWNALAAIAEEVQNFQSSNINNTELNESNEESEDLRLCKLKLQTKKTVIKNLQENLKTACMIAKTVLKEKENDLVSYNNNLAVARKESAELLKQNAELSKKVQNLRDENKNLTNTVQNMQSFIDLGYTELQKMLHEVPEDVHVLVKLKKIMICCGQYYADYSNERDACHQLEQKNRYLNNKVSILENGLSGVTAELNRLKRQRSGKKGQKDTKNDTFRRTRTVGFVCSEYRLGKVSPTHSSSSTTLTSLDNNQPVKETESLRSIALPFNSDSNTIDLSPHFSIVKNLLNDQDSMLQDLKNLANELNTLDIFYETNNNKTFISDVEP